MKTLTRLGLLLSLCPLALQALLANSIPHVIAVNDERTWDTPLVIRQGFIPRDPKEIHQGLGSKYLGFIRSRYDPNFIMYVLCDFLQSIDPKTNRVRTYYFEPDTVTTSNRWKDKKTDALMERDINGTVCQYVFGKRYVQWDHSVDQNFARDEWSSVGLTTLQVAFTLIPVGRAAELTYGGLKLGATYVFKSVAVKAFSNRIFQFALGGLVFGAWFNPTWIGVDYVDKACLKSEPEREIAVGIGFFNGLSANYYATCADVTNWNSYNGKPYVIKHLFGPDTPGPVTAEGQILVASNDPDVYGKDLIMNIANKLITYTKRWSSNYPDVPGVKAENVEIKNDCQKKFGPYDVTCTTPHVWARRHDAVKEKKCKNEFNPLVGKVGRVCEDHWRERIWGDSAKNKFAHIPQNVTYRHDLFPELYPQYKARTKSQKIEKMRLRLDLYDVAHRARVLRGEEAWFAQPKTPSELESRIASKMNLWWLAQLEKRQCDRENEVAWWQSMFDSYFR